MRQQLPQMKEIKPSILYYGTPVLLLSTLNEDGSTNISPLSSSWALGEYIVLGLGVGGQALDNLQRHGECVINLPDPTLVDQVEAIATFTGKHPVPDYKKKMGYTYLQDKFSAGRFTPGQSDCVKPSRILECPLQIEARVKQIRTLPYAPVYAIVETQVERVHAHEQILLNDRHIDTQQWSPLIYNFRHYFGLGERVGKNFRAET